jgi:hypothetical protein
VTHARGAALAAILAPSIASAQSPPRVVLVADRDSDLVGMRLVGELSALGFEVVAVAVDPGTDAGREPLEELARERQAVAALRVVPLSGGVEVWIVDRVTGKTVLREVVTAGEGETVEEVVALRSVELLRASLMEIDAPHRVRGEVAPPPNIRRVVPRPRPPPAPPPRLSLGLAPALLPSPGGMGLPVDVRVWVRHRAGERWGWTAIGLVPVVPAHVEAPEGEADGAPWLLGGGLDLYLTAPGAPFGGVLGAGGALALVQMQGISTQQPYRLASDGALVSAGYLSAGATYALTPFLRLAADCVGGIAFPEVQMKFGGRAAATWGTPFLAVSAGIEVAWP